MCFYFPCLEIHSIGIPHIEGLTVLISMVCLTGYLLLDGVTAPFEQQLQPGKINTRAWAALCLACHSAPQGAVTVVPSLPPRS